MTQLRITLLGPFQALVDADRPVNLATDKIRALLSYLAVEADRPHRREVLAALLWPDMPDKQAKANLRLSLHRLRGAVDKALPAGSDDLLTITRQTVQLHAAAAAIDFWTFANAVSDGESHAHRSLASCPDCLRQLGAAADLYQGELLAGLFVEDAPPFEDWLIIQRESMHQQALLLFHTLADALLQAGDYEHAQQLAQRQIALESWSESAHQQAMRALALNGQRSQALAQYETCRQILADELGVEPMPETQALRQQIQQGDLTAAARESAVTQRHHFPTQLTPFVGRQMELDAIGRELADPDCRLLSLIGPGGMGKTRLAIQAVQQIVSDGAHYADGVFFVPLAAVEEAPLVAGALAAALGLTLTERNDPARQIADYLSAKKLLLLLDNFEHVLPAAALVNEIVNFAAGVQIVTTTRAPLALRAERRFTVGGLDFPDADQGDAAAAAFEDAAAVRLFLQSARQMRPGFSVDGDGLLAIARLCRLVDGMPLALEIAAAWTRLMDPATIVGEAERRLDFLAAPFADLPERHQSIAGVFTQTWQQLNRTERQVLGQAAQFQGSFALTALTEIAPAASLLIVANLLDKSLLKRASGTRYEIHELLRQFIQTQVTVAPEFSGRFVDYYLNWLAALTEPLQGPQPEQALDQLQLDWGNIRQAWNWAVAAAAAPALAAAVAALGRFLSLTGRWREGADLFGDSLTAIESWAEPAPALTGRLHRRRAHLLTHLGQFETALFHAQTALELATAHDGDHNQALAAATLGECLRQLSQFDKARAHLETAAAQLTAGSPIPEAAHVLNELGMVRLNQARYPEARDLFNQALQICRAVQDQAETAQTLGNLGYIHELMSQYTPAHDYLQQALAIAQQINDRQGIVKQQIGLGKVDIERGNLAAAEAHLNDALALARTLGYRRGVITVLEMLAQIKIYQGAPGEARDQLRYAERLALEGDLKDLLTNVVGRIAITYARQGKYDEALAEYRRAIELGRELSDLVAVARNIANMASVYFRLGDMDSAMIALEESLPLARAVGARRTIANILIKMAFVFKRLGQYEKAIAYHEEALQIDFELGQKDGIGKNIGALGIMHYEMGDYEKALVRYREAFDLSEELGDRLTSAVWLGNIGEVYFWLADYDQAVHYLDLALERHKHLEGPQYRADVLRMKAETFLAMGQFQRARLIVDEAHEIGTRVGEKPFLFQIDLIQARLQCATGAKAQGIAALEALLAAAIDDNQQARVLFYLWFYGRQERHAAAARELLTALLAQTPNHEYRHYLRQLAPAE